MIIILFIIFSSIVFFVVVGGIGGCRKRKNKLICIPVSFFLLISKADFSLLVRMNCCQVLALPLLGLRSSLI